METKYFTMDEKKLIKDKFADIPDKFKVYLNESNVIFLYSIIDIRTNKTVYVGKTKNFNNRVMQYVSAYIRGDSTRPIDLYIAENGIENFIMRVTEVVFTDDMGIVRERALMSDLDTIDDGLNCSINSRSCTSKGSGNFLSTKHTAAAKKSKSKLVCIMSPAQNKLIICTGLKLAGDIIGRKKDDVKTHAKTGTMIESFFVYYLNYIDYNIIYDKVSDKFNKMPDNNKRFDVKLYGLYLEYADYLKQYLKSLGVKNPKNFECVLATQSDDLLHPIVYSSPEDFLKTYSLSTFKIYN